jgi:ADP-L-glycero-D-manno-heptose 6-epimerase
MRILLTGNKGFIGQNFEQHLTQAGHEVVGFDFRPYRKTNADGSQMFPSLDGIDQVIHLGAWSSTTETNVQKVLDDNYEFSYKLLMMCCEAGINMQYASSASVYGTLSKWSGVQENASENPLNPYAWSKYLFDRLVQKSLGTLPITVQGFRYFNVWGPHENMKGEQASLFHKWVLVDEKIKVFKYSELFYRDFIHVDDVFNLQHAMLKNPESGIFNVGTGTSKSIQSLADDISSKYNKPIEYVDMPPNLLRHYQEFTCADNSKILQAIDSENYSFMTLDDVDSNLRALS